MNQPKKRFRTAVLCFLIFPVFVVYVLQLMQMQVVDGEKYIQELNKGSTQEQTVEAARGEILDRYGNALAINTTGYNVVLDKAFLPSEEQNRIILDLTRVLTDAGEQWIDNLPITREEPLQFLGAGYESKIERLKKDIDVQPSTTVEDVMYWLAKRYGLQDYPLQEQRTIAGIRYEMERRGFSLKVRYTFAENISIATVAKVKELGFSLKGVTVVESPVRQYVSGDTAPHIIGYVGSIYSEEYAELKKKGYRLSDVVGKAGVEARFEDTLRGKDGVRKITMNAQGDVIEEVVEKDPVPGNTVVLTIDSKLQQTALTALERQIKLLQETAPEGEGREAESGAVVAIDCKTGEILVAASYPSYDMDTYKNNYSSLLAEDAGRPLFNRALDGTYAAGSCYKPTVGIAGLAQGVITPQSTITCNRVYTAFEDYQPTCLGYHGAITVMDALRVSCNIFFYEVGRELGLTEDGQYDSLKGIETINHYAAQFGLGQPTGIEIHEEIGQLSSPEVKAIMEPGKPWTAGDTVQSAIGQLYNSFSPLQLAVYTSTIANRGKRLEAHIVKSIESYSFDKTVYQAEPKVADEVDAPPEAFEAVVDGMVRASRIGTSQRYLGDYFCDVASKTGTPQTHQFPNSTFIAFAPAQDPQIAIAVVIEKGWHGYTGAPVAREVFNEYFYSDSEQAATEGYLDLLP